MRFDFDPVTGRDLTTGRKPGHDEYDYLIEEDHTEMLDEIAARWAMAIVARRDAERIAKEGK
jgi:hypothetical protein